MKLNVTFFAVLFLTTSVSLGNLVAHYEFNGDANDSVGSYHGTLYDGASIVNDPQHGQVLSLDGVNDYVQTPMTQSIPSWTIACWIKSPYAPAGGGNNGPIDKYANFSIN